jgi:hypothetical protein
MNNKKRLAKADIIGRKIDSVYEIKLNRVGRFHPRLTFVRLNNELIFDMDSIRDPESEEPLNIWSADYQKALPQVLSKDKDPSLDSPIKSIVFAEHFENGGAILPENDFVLTIGVGEFGMGYIFYLPSVEFRNHVTMEVAD